MTHTNTNEKAPGACNSKGLTTDTNGADFPTTDDEGKAFQTLVTGFAQPATRCTKHKPKTAA